MTDLILKKSLHERIQQVEWRVIQIRGRSERHIVNAVDHFGASYTRITDDPHIEVVEFAKQLRIMMERRGQAMWITVDCECHDKHKYVEAIIDHTEFYDNR